MKYWDKAWSLVEGCTPVSPACDNCWLASIEHRFHGQDRLNHKRRPEDILISDGHFNGTVRTRSDRLDIPLKRKKPTVYAVWSDLFHDDVPYEFIEQALDVMARSPQHTFLILTKRPNRMYNFFDIFVNTTLADYGGLRDFDHIYYGVTAENQKEANDRIFTLLTVPGIQKRFVSIEPMLGPIELDGLVRIISPGDEHHFSCLVCDVDVRDDTDFHGASLDLVILGGESGTGARPMHPEWARGVRDQCQAVGVPFFFKQWGEWIPFDRDLIKLPAYRGHEIVAISLEDGSQDYWEKFPKQSSQGFFNDTQAWLCKSRALKDLKGHLLDAQKHNKLPWRSE